VGWGGSVGGMTQMLSSGSGSSRPGSSASAPASPAPLGPSRVRRVLCAVAVVACLPYIALKATWLGGSRLGISPGGRRR
jgi:hypothetical protein